MPNTAFADYKSDIIASCTDYQQGKDNREINACKLYIDGFIDSALQTDDATISHKAPEAKEFSQSSYLKRAYKTRVYNPTLKKANDATRYFCIPKDHDRKAVASKIAKSLAIEQLNSKAFKEVVLDALIAEFPCQ
jgi:hypothetical protein